MADDAAAAEERRKKAQARKEKLASRGADRLAKITGAAKGEGEAPRFGTGGSAAPPRANAAPSSPVSPRATLPALAAPAFNPLDDPPDVDISTPQAMRGFDDIPNLLAQDPNNAGDMPDFLTSLLSGAGGGAGGADGGFPQQFAQMFGGQPGSTPVHIQAPRQKTWTDRLLPLVHVLSMVGLAFYAIFVIEPRLREGYGSIYTAFSDRSTWTSIGNVDWNGWAALSRGKQGDSTTSAYAQGVEKAWLGTGRGVATVQLMYLFLTLELMLQTSAILIFKTRPPMPSLLNTIMPYLPPKYASYAYTGMKYWSLLGQLLDDLAVLVLSVVTFILCAEHFQFGQVVDKIKAE